MTEFALYREPVLLDTTKHRQLKLLPTNTYSAANRMHASYLSAVEFPAAMREFVIVFSRSADAAGQTQMSPIVLLGITPGENLFLDGTRWDAQCVPAYIRRYPFWTTQIEGREMPSVMIDEWWQGFSQTEGDPLFEADGTPAPKLAEVIEFVQMYEQEAGRTQAFCDHLARLDLFREMTADLTLPDGSKQTLSDFFSIDDAKLQALPDAAVLELFRNGMLGLIHAHLLSMANMQALVARKGRRLPAAP